MLNGVNTFERSYLFQLLPFTFILWISLNAVITSIGQINMRYHFTLNPNLDMNHLFQQKSSTTLSFQFQLFWSWINRIAITSNAVRDNKIWFEFKTTTKHLLVISMCMNRKQTNSYVFSRLNGFNIQLEDLILNLTSN